MADFQWASGLLLGLSAGAAPGPLLTLVITQTLRHGQGEGIKVALAPLITDLPIIVAALALGSRLAGMPTPLGLLSLAGAAYVGFLAWESLTLTNTDHDASPQAPRSLRKGILANLLNPHPYLFWLTVGTPLVVSAWSAAPWCALIWLLGFYIMLVGTKVLLAIVTGHSRNWLQGKGYLWLNRLLGATLLFFALFMAKDGLSRIGLWASS